MASSAQVSPVDNCHAGGAQFAKSVTASTAFGFAAYELQPSKGEIGDVVGIQLVGSNSLQDGRGIGVADGDLGSRHKSGECALSPLVAAGEVAPFSQGIECGGHDNGSSGQRWRLRHGSNGSFRVQQANGGRVVGVAADSQGAQAVLRDDNGASTNFWHFI